MKVPLSWLRELVQIEVPLPELRQRLTMAGLEVEEVHEVGSDWRDVTIGRIVELEPHPRRDALKVARVDLGGRNVTVVTGATNLKVGDVVPHVAVQLAIRSSTRAKPSASCVDLRVRSSVWQFVQPSSCFF